MNGWTPDAVQSLAPDAAAARAGAKLAVRAPWSEAGHDERAVWGLCKGSGKQPYQAQVDLRGPAFKCSCPSRKYPCKHTLGLLLLWAQDPAAVPAGTPPEWVREWLSGREARASRVARRADEAPRDPDAAARRAAQRSERVAAGVQDLRLWLADVARAGLAAAQARPYGFWDGFAARLVDAQAPGLAGRVRYLGGIAAARGDTWPERLLEELGLLYLACEAQGRPEAMEEPLRADVRALVGWTTPREEVLAGPRVRDRWAVLAREFDEPADRTLGGWQDRLRVQRTWLWGLDGGRPALLLDFAPPGAPIDPGPPVGMALAGELAFYPGATPLRALVAGEPAALEPVREPFGVGSAAAALAAAAAAVAANPWTDSWPVALDEAIPDVPGDGPVHVHAGGGALRLSGSREALWRLAALSGGTPISLLGTWNGQTLRPLAAYADERVVSL
jgi:SWIM zinc finger